MLIINVLVYDLSSREGGEDNLIKNKDLIDLG